MTRPFRVGFCVSGEGRLFRAAVQRCEQLGIEPALLAVTAQAAAELDGVYSEHGIGVHRLATQPRAAFDRDITRACVAANLDLLCLTFDRILPADLVNHYHGRIINTHMSLLPAFPGLHGISDALAAGARFAGATIHEVEIAVDSGAIVAQCLEAVRREDTVGTVGRRLFGLLRPMFLQVIAWYAAGRIEHDSLGRVWVRDAVYGQLPMSPAIEQSFAD